MPEIKPSPLYEAWKQYPPVWTIEHARKHILELREHVERLESDADMEFFERIIALEEKVEALKEWKDHARKRS